MNIFLENIGEKIWKYDFWKDFKPRCTLLARVFVVDLFPSI